MYILLFRIILSVYAVIESGETWLFIAHFEWVFVLSHYYTSIFGWIHEYVHVKEIHFMQF